MENTNEQQIIAKMQDGDMTYVEYLRQYDDDVWDEYIQFCKTRELNPEEDDSALSFIEFREDELDACMDE